MPDFHPDVFATISHTFLDRLKPVNDRGLFGTPTKICFFHLK